MRVKKNPINDPVLKEIEAAFAAFRRKHKGVAVRYPFHLKQLAISSISKVHRASTIARTAGVSVQSLGYWQKTTDELPRELKVVVDNHVDGAIDTTGEKTARIHLSSKVTIEIPISSLTTSLVAVFNSAVT